MLEAFKIKYSKIKNIKKVGKKRTYDIEMDKEPYNFIANNFVSHNSHSVSYSYLGYQMAYLKCYYRKYFNLGVLNNLEVSKKQDQEKMRKTLDECESWDLHIKPYNLNEISLDFTLDPEGNIIAGAKSIKGLGEKGLLDIVVAKPYTDLSDFLTRAKPKKNVLEILNDNGFIENTFGIKMANEDLISMRDNLGKKKKGSVAKIKTATMFDEDDL